MVLGFSKSEIIELAIRNKSDIADGVCQYDYEDGHIFGCSFTQGTLENPLNPFIELFRISQNDDLDCSCYDCPFDYESDKRIECCEDATIDYYIENFDEQETLIQGAIRDVISNIISKDLDKLNQIRLGIYENFYSTTQYEQQLYNNNYEMEVLDELVDNAYDNGLIINEAKEFLSNSVDELMNKLDYIRDDNFMYNNLSEEEDNLAYNLHEALYNYDLDKALELLR